MLLRIRSWLLSLITEALQTINRRTEQLLKGQLRIMSNLTALATEFKAYHTDVTTKINALGGKIDDLQKAVDAGDDSAAVAELLGEVQAAHAELSGAAANPPAVPAPPAEGDPGSTSTEG